MLKAEDGMKWDQLEHGLLELNGNQVPELTLEFERREYASDSLRVMLEESALSRLCALDKVEIKRSFQGRKYFRIPGRDIINAPTHHTVDDFTITLDTAQRVEWLLQYPPQTKEPYLDRLLQTARAQAQADRRRHEERGADRDIGR